MNLNKLHKWSYLIMAVLTLVLLIAVIVVSNTGENEQMKGPLVVTLFVIYAVLQTVCVVFMKPKLSVYRIGFYVLHVGIVVMLVGFALYEIAGQSLHVNVPVNSSGDVYTQIQNEDKSFTDLGFGIRLNNFSVDTYESGAPRQYIANVGVYEGNSATGAMYNSDNVVIEVNKTYRRNGWKIFLMSYDDGSSAMPGVLPVEEYSSVGGAQAAVSLMMSSGKYDNANIDYFEYDPAKGGRVALGTDPEIWKSMTGKYTAKVYKSENSDYYYVVLSRTYVQLLFKKDPGEFVTLTGMVMTILGVVMMCLIRGKKAGDEGGSSEPETAGRSVSSGAKKGSGKI